MVRKNKKENKQISLIRSDPRLAAINAEYETLVADMEEILAFQEAAYQWAKLYQETEASPAKLALFDHAEGQRANEILKGIRENRVQAARFLERWGVPAHRLTVWAMSQRPEDYAAVWADITQAAVKHDLANDQFRQRIEAFQAELQQQTPQELQAEEISLDEEAFCVLCALASYPSQRVTQDYIAAAAFMSRNTIADRLDELKASGLASQKGKRGRYAITGAGLNKLRTLALTDRAKNILEGTRDGQKLLMEMGRRSAK